MKGCFCDVKIVICQCCKKFHVYATEKIQGSETKYYNYDVPIISDITQMIKSKLKGITWQSLWSAMQEYISDLAGRSLISCNWMKMDTTIVRTFALITSASLTVRAVRFVLCSRFFCGNNGSSQQHQFKVFFTIPWLLHQINEQVLTNL